LVNWFNQVDATYRSDLRELNELNFARFDAKLEQRVAELDAKLDQRVGQLESRLEQRVSEVRGDIASGLSELKAELVKWMFAFWAGTTLTLLATMIALIKL
jgi:CRP-like cAMP-binding protein